MRKSLGEQLLEISNSASGWNEGEDPESFDAFNNNHGAESGGSDVSDDDEGEMGDGINSAKQHYLQVGKSRLKSNLGIDMQEANSAYIGKRVSRKDFYDEKQQSDMEVDDDDDEEEDEDVIFEQDDEEGGDGVHDFDSDDYQVLNPNANSSQQGNEDDDDEEEVEEKSDDQDDSDFDAREQKLVEKQMFQLQEQEKQLVQSMSQDSKSDIEKGRHVRNQMNLYDQMLNARIRLQQLLHMGNRLPHSEKAAGMLKGNTDVQEAFQEASSAMFNLLSDMVDYRSNLILADEALYTHICNNAPSTTITCIQERKRKRQELSQSTPFEQVHCMWKDINAIENAFVPYRDETIKKWCDKIQTASATSVGAHKKFKTINQGTLDQIKTLMNDKERLVKKTRLKRGSYKILGEESSNAVEEEDGNHLEKYDKEIFDDEDFYSMLLKEFIESKIEDGDDPVALSLKALQIRQLTKKAKKKKNVDTKASKGRKIRYQVHEKLMNFMAPVPVATWHKDMVDELFVGLFGGLSASSVEDQSKPKKKRSDKGAEDASSMGGSVWNGLGEITVLR